MFWWFRRHGAVTDQDISLIITWQIRPKMALIVETAKAIKRQYALGVALAAALGVVVVNVVAVVVLVAAAAIAVVIVSLGAAPALEIGSRKYAYEMIVAIVVIVAIPERTLRKILAGVESTPAPPVLIAGSLV